MPFIEKATEYLRKLQREYKSSVTDASHTAELSYRPMLDGFIKDMVQLVGLGQKAQVVFEPNNQFGSGRPDWRIHDKVSLGIYGYVEAKGIGPNPLDYTPHKEQIERYLSLGHKLLFTDGVDFIFFFDKDELPIKESIFDKDDFTASDWSTLNISARLESLFQMFLSSPSQNICTENKLISLVAVRTRLLSDDIHKYASLTESDALNESEKEEIKLLSSIRQLLYNHQDVSFHSASAFADFTAQVIMFCLLYAHRVICLKTDTPVQKEQKIKDYITSAFSTTQELYPFRNLMKFLNENASNSSFVNQWVDECVKTLSFTQMKGDALIKPDFHKLFEQFLAEYDKQSRFDYGAFYTPKILADYVVQLTEAIVHNTFDGASIFDTNNTIIDPCCGTGSFLESIITHDNRNGHYGLFGFEIFPAPYMLANYRLALVRQRLGASRKQDIGLVLANTLSNCVMGEAANTQSIEGLELDRAFRISSLPLKLIIGNPPCSDSIRENNTPEYSIINSLMDDFRPPVSNRTIRQNTQKQVNNPYMQFIRWSCEKLINSTSNSVLSFIVPSSFLEAESYKYARLFLAHNFSYAWIVLIDSDARTGVRSSSIFHTLQGRAIIILTRKYNDKNTIEKFKFLDYASDPLSKKQNLQNDIQIEFNKFTEYTIDNQSYKFIPSKQFNREEYLKFWPISGLPGTQAIFKHYCSGSKLAPTALFTHVNSSALKRRCKEISLSGFLGTTSWFDGQDKKPQRQHVEAFQNALNSFSSSDRLEAHLSKNIKKYSFRPFLTSNVLLWEDLLKSYSRIGGGGTRLRPEIIKAYKNKNTFGFALAHAPKDLSDELSQFTSFCWYNPDNDMCRRGNSYIYLNQYPQGQDDEISSNINDDLAIQLETILGKKGKTLSNAVVFYCYAILCSQMFLDEFEGALFTLNQSDSRTRIPIVKDAIMFNKLAKLGEQLANLEKDDYQPSNKLNFNYQAIIDSIPNDFKLQRGSSPFDLVNNQIVLRDHNREVRIDCPTEIQTLCISGYNVIKDIWLKFNSYDFTHMPLSNEAVEGLLNTINKLYERELIVGKVDELLAEVFHGDIELLLPEAQ